MSDYYKEEDLERFKEIGKHSPELFKKFMDWYNSALEPGLLTKREKVLIGLAVAHAIHCPYCIDAYTQSTLSEGMSLEQDHAPIPRHEGSRRCRLHLRRGCQRAEGPHDLGKPARSRSRVDLPGRL